MARIQQVAARIAEAVHPEAIILFGSQADGTATPESDVDFLVVMPDCEDPRSAYCNTYRAISDAAGDCGFAKDVLVYTVSQVLQKRGRFGAVGDALRRGQILYLSPGSNFLELVFTGEEQTLSKPDDFDIMLLLAERDFSDAEKMQDPEMFSEAGFGLLLQQSAEKALKAWILHLGRIPPRLHELDKLLAIIQPLDPDAEEYTQLKELNPYAVLFRYSDDPEERCNLPRDEALALVRRLLEHLKTFLPKS